MLLADDRLSKGGDDEEIGEGEERLGKTMEVVHIGEDLVVRHFRCRAVWEGVRTRGNGLGVRIGGGRSGGVGGVDGGGGGCCHYCCCCCYCVAAASVAAWAATASAAA